MVDTNLVFGPAGVVQEQLIEGFKELDARVNALAQKMEDGNVELVRLLEAYKAQKPTISDSDEVFTDEIERWRQTALYRAKENDAMWKLLNWYRAQYPTAVEPKS